MAQSKPCAFNKLAPELRALIFTPCLTFEPEPQINGVGMKTYQDASAPALLGALCGDPKLYAEALEIYYRVNTFWLTVRTQNAFLNLNQNAIASIKKLVICFIATSSAKALLEDTSPHLNLVINISELSFDISGICHPAILDLTQDCPVIWTAVCRLEVKISVFVSIDPDGKRVRKLQDVERGLGRRADEKVEESGVMWSSIAWTWRA